MCIRPLDNPVHLRPFLDFLVVVDAHQTLVPVYKVPQFRDIGSPHHVGIHEHHPFGPVILQQGNGKPGKGKLRRERPVILVVVHLSTAVHTVSPVIDPLLSQFPVVERDDLDRNGSVLPETSGADLVGIVVPWVISDITSDHASPQLDNIPLAKMERATLLTTIRARSFHTIDTTSHPIVPRTWRYRLKGNMFCAVNVMATSNIIDDAHLRYHNLFLSGNFHHFRA